MKPEKTAKKLDFFRGELSPAVNAQRVALYKKHSAYSENKAEWTLADYANTFYLIEKWALAAQYPQASESDFNGFLDRIAQKRAVDATLAFIKKKGELPPKIYAVRAEQIANIRFSYKGVEILSQCFLIARNALKKQNPTEAHNPHGVFWQIAQKQAEWLAQDYLKRRGYYIAESNGYAYFYSADDFKNADSPDDFFNLPWKKSGFFGKNYVWDAVY